MPNILKPGAKVGAAKTFLKNFYDAVSPDRIYIGLGAAVAEWGTPASPDVPLNTYQAEKDFWQYMIGMGQVSAAQTELVVPRKTWVAGATYVVFNASGATGSGTFDTGAGRNFYIITSLDRVYRLITAGGGVVADEPTHRSPIGQGGAGDGYNWAYMYTVGGGQDVSSTQLTTSWMPVPSSVTATYSNGMAAALGQLCQGDGSAGYPTTQIYQIHAQSVPNNVSAGANMAADTANTWVEWNGDQELGAFYASCSLAFPDSVIPNVAYRQIALLRNPKDNVGIRILDAWKSTNFEAFGTLTRGVVLTLDNRTTITRTVGQTETVRIILEF